MNFEFKLKYQLPSTGLCADQLVDKLGEAGCTDALVGLGVPAQVALEFVREASSSQEAILSALTAVKRALPGARLIDAEPDIARLSEVLNGS